MTGWKKINSFIADWLLGGWLFLSIRELAALFGMRAEITIQRGSLPKAGKNYPPGSDKGNDSKGGRKARLHNTFYNHPEPLSDCICDSQGSKDGQHCVFQ